MQWGGNDRRRTCRAVGIALAVLLAAAAGADAVVATTRAAASPRRAAAGVIAVSPPERPAPGKGPVAPSAAAGPSLSIRRAWIAVPVATVWSHPGTARPADARAVSAHPDLAGWLASLDLNQKLGLDDLLATQSLFGQPVVVYGRQGIWDHVVVLGQTGSVYPFGIAGWIPDAQLRFTAPPTSPVQATVAVPLLAVGGLTLSYGTPLPVVAAGAGQMTVALPQGRFPVPASALRTAPLAPSGAAAVSEAERFLGLPYLWAGTSAYGYDCSGLTYSVYHQFGVTLARDAADQARHGTPVDRNALRPGDLVFFAFGGPVDHVGIYAGHGMMIDAPRTGAVIELVPLWGGPLAGSYAGARRYL